MNEQEFRVEKAIKKKGNKLCVKWKGYDDTKTGPYCFFINSKAKTKIH